jgi:DNA primase catalytic core, N-terminal domain
MSGRVVIPIHNERGELVAYAGRSLKDDDPGGKYKLPPGFHKGQALFNRKGAAEILSRLVARFFVRAVNLPDNMQPDKLPEQQIREILVF